jgi:hypothetical protein
MVGLIWMIQIVHYPLFGLVGSDTFKEYHQEHTILITPIVGIVMVVELVSSMIMILQPVRGISIIIPISGLILILFIWASTAFLQIPYHQSLNQTYDPHSINMLILTNWIRTIAWSLRGLITMYILFKLLKI